LHIRWTTGLDETCRTSSRRALAFSDNSCWIRPPEAGLPVCLFESKRTIKLIETDQSFENKEL
jgi:hypothetical protein